MQGFLPRVHCYAGTEGFQSSYDRQKTVGLLQKRWLAAAVLLDALTRICESCDNSRRKRAVSEDLEWVFSDEIEGAFCFLQLCGLLGFEASIIRDFILLRIYNHSALA